MLGYWAPTLTRVYTRVKVHDSSLCAASMAVRARFARELDNLTLATPELNRNEKRGHRRGLTRDRNG